MSVRLPLIVTHSGWRRVLLVLVVVWCAGVLWFPGRQAQHAYRGDRAAIEHAQVPDCHVYESDLAGMSAEEQNSYATMFGSPLPGAPTKEDLAKCSAEQVASLRWSNRAIVSTEAAVDVYTLVAVEIVAGIVGLLLLGMLVEWIASGFARGKRNNG